MFLLREFSFVAGILKLNTRDNQGITAFRKSIKDGRVGCSLIIV